MIKSLLRYQNGKIRAVETIARLLPDFDEFREPFLGSVAIFMYVKQRFLDRDIFTHTNNIAHYNMMVNVEQEKD